MATRGVNKVILIGNLGRDPEARYTAGGTAVTNVSIATSDTWRDKQSGEMQERTEWHRVVFWQRLAEVVAEYLAKGSKIYIEGRLQTRKWQDQGGQDRYTTEIVANQMQMLDSRAGNGNQGQSHGQQQRSQQGQPPLPQHDGIVPTPDQQRNQQQSTYQQQMADMDDDALDDDIPF